MYIYFRDNTAGMDALFNDDQHFDTFLKNFSEDFYDATGDFLREGEDYSVVYFDEDEINPIFRIWRRD